MSLLYYNGLKCWYATVRGLKILQKQKITYNSTIKYTIKHKKVYKKYLKRMDKNLFWKEWTKITKKYYKTHKHTQTRRTSPKSTKKNHQWSPKLRSINKASTKSDKNTDEKRFYYLYIQGSVGSVTFIYIKPHSYRVILLNYALCEWLHCNHILLKGTSVGNKAPVFLPP